MKISPDVDIEAIAADTRGQVGADLAGLCNRAALQCIREKMEFIDIYKFDAEVINSLTVTMNHFRAAMAQSNPCMLPQTVVVPCDDRDDIGGLEDTKRYLKSSNIPSNTPIFTINSVSSLSRVPVLWSPWLWQDPPRQSLCKRVSSQFISVKGSELLTLLLRDPEANIREIFDKAIGITLRALFRRVGIDNYH